MSYFRKFLIFSFFTLLLTGCDALSAKPPHAGGGNSSNGAFSAPSHLTILNSTIDKVDMKWQDNSGGKEDHFAIYRSLNSDSNFSKVGTTPKNTTSFVDIGVEPATTYYYKVQAIDRNGKTTGYSNVVIAITPGSPPPPVPNQFPTADFSVSCNYLICDFADNSQDSDGNIISYSWNLGDGNISTATNFQHSFASAGEYSVTLTVTDDKGAQNTITKTATAYEEPPPPNEAPTANFEVNCDDLMCVVSSTSTDSDGFIDSVVWNFGDNTTANNNVESHTYASAGSYNITLTVTDDDGAQDSVTKPVTVEEEPVEPPTGISVELTGTTTYDYHNLRKNFQVKVEGNSSDIQSIQVIMDNATVIASSTGSEIWCSTTLCRDYVDINISNLTSGSHSLHAVVTDSTGLTGESSPMSITITRLDPKAEILGYVPGTFGATDVSVNDTGTRAYLSSELFGVSVVDVSNKTHTPVISSMAMADKILGLSIATSGNKGALIGYKNRDGNYDDGARLQFLNVSANTVTAAATLRGIDMNEGYFRSVVMTDSYAYVFGRGSNQIFVFNIQDINDPILSKTLSVPTGDYFSYRQLALFNDKLLYISASGLNVYSLSQPGSPSLIATHSAVKGSGISISNSLGFVMDGSILRIVDLTNNYTQTSSITTDLSSFQSISSMNSRAYITHGNRTNIIDASNPYAPTIIYSEYLGARNLLAKNGYVYRVDYDQIGTIRDKNAVFQIWENSGSSFNQISNTIDYIAKQSMDVQGNLAVAVGLTRAKLIDVSDSSNPKVISTILPRGDKWEFFGGVIHENYLYLQGYPKEEFGLDVYDIQNPASPMLVQQVQGVSSDGNVPLQGNSNNLVAVGYNLGTRLFDLSFYSLSNPAQPQLTNTMSFNNKPWIRHIDDQIMVAYFRAINTLEVYDISNAQNPALILTKTGTIHSATVSENILYLTADNALEAYDLSNLASPQMLYAEPFSRWTTANYGLVVHDGIAYVNYGELIRAYDIRYPSDILYIADTALTEYSTQMALTNKAIYFLGNGTLISTMSLD